MEARSVSGRTRGTGLLERAVEVEVGKAAAAAVDLLVKGVFQARFDGVVSDLVAPARGQGPVELKLPGGPVSKEGTIGNVVKLLDF